MVIAATPAEALLILAARIKHPPGKVITHTGLMTGEDMARCELAMKFERLSPGTKFRALFEAWDFRRIVEEVY